MYDLVRTGRAVLSGPSWASSTSRRPTCFARSGRSAWLPGMLGGRSLVSLTREPTAFAPSWGPPLLLLGYLCYVLQVSRCPVKLQQRILSLLGAIARLVQLPLRLRLPGDQALAFTQLEGLGPVAPAPLVSDSLGYLDIGEVEQG